MCTRDLERAFHLQKNGRLEEALEVIDHVLASLNSENPEELQKRLEALLLKAELLHQMMKFPALNETCQEAVQALKQLPLEMSQPYQVKLNMLLGRTYYYRFEFEAAIHHFQYVHHATKHDPNERFLYLRATFNLGLCHHNMGNLGMARKYLEEILLVIQGLPEDVKTLSLWFSSHAFLTILRFLMTADEFQLRLNLGAFVSRAQDLFQEHEELNQDWSPFRPVLHRIGEGASLLLALLIRISLLTLGEPLLSLITKLLDLTHGELHGSLLYDVAHYLALKGELDAAWEWFEKITQARQSFQKDVLLGGEFTRAHLVKLDHQRIPDKHVRLAEASRILNAVFERATKHGYVDYQIRAQVALITIHVEQDDFKGALNHLEKVLQLLQGKHYHVLLQLTLRTLIHLHCLNGDITAAQAVLHTLKENKQDDEASDYFINNLIQEEEEFIRYHETLSHINMEASEPELNEARAKIIKDYLNEVKKFLPY